MTQSSALHVLLIEDQPNIARNIAQYMEDKGHVFDFAINGKQGLTLAMETFYDLVILDLTLPKMDGLEVCQRLRAEADRHIPILMLTARDSIEDKVSGFNVGTDDYLTKPFSLQELEVRCLALSRRNTLHVTDNLQVGSLIINRKTLTATRAGVPLSLHSMGFKILTVLAEAYPQVVSRSELSAKLWGDEPTESDALRSHVYQLRTVLDKPFQAPMLKTVFGVGFTLEIQDDEDTSNEQ